MAWRWWCQLPEPLPCNHTPAASPSLGGCAAGIAAALLVACCAAGVPVQQPASRAAPPLPKPFTAPVDDARAPPHDAPIPCWSLTAALTTLGPSSPPSPWIPPPSPTASQHVFIPSPVHPSGHRPLPAPGVGAGRRHPPGAASAHQVRAAAVARVIGRSSGMPALPAAAPAGGLLPRRRPPGAALAGASGSCRLGGRGGQPASHWQHPSPVATAPCHCCGSSLITPFPFALSLQPAALSGPQGAVQARRGASPRRACRRRPRPCPASPR